MENPTMAASSYTATLGTKITCVHLEEEWYNSKATYITNIILVVMNLLTALSATVGNSLILLAVWRTPNLRTPSNTLLCCLAFSDFLVGLIVQPTNALEIIFEMKQNLPAYCVTKIITTGSLSWICAGVSFLVICAISVERYLAIKLHLRYETIVTVRRVLFVVLIFWVVCTSLVTARFLGVSYNALVITVVVMDITCIIITVTAYFKIYQQVRALQRKAINQLHLAPDIHSFKRSAITMLYIITLFLATFIPFITILVVKMHRGGGLRLNIIYNFFATFVYFSSSMNPFVYCFRLKEIRIAVFKILGRKYTIDMNGDVIPVSRTISNQKINNLKNSHAVTPRSSNADLRKIPETDV